eukprot:403336411
MIQQSQFRQRQQLKQKQQFNQFANNVILKNYKSIVPIDPNQIPQNIKNQANNQQSDNAQVQIQQKDQSSLTFGFQSLYNQSRNQQVLWHINRGVMLDQQVRLLSYGSTNTAVILQNLMKLNPNQKKSYIKKVSETIICFTSLKESQKQERQPNGLISFKTYYKQYCEQFRQTDSKAQKELKKHGLYSQFIGTKTIQDCFFFNKNAPLGTSMFQSKSEMAEGYRCFSQLTEKYLNNQRDDIQRERAAKKKKKPIYEPQPNKDHTYCMICQMQFPDFLVHIFGEHHKTQVRRGENQWLFNGIDQCIKSINQGKLNQPRKISLKQSSSLSQQNLKFNKSDDKSLGSDTSKSTIISLDDEEISPIVFKDLIETNQKNPNEISTHQQSIMNRIDITTNMQIDNDSIFIISESNYF